MLVKLFFLLNFIWMAILVKGFNRDNSWSSFLLSATVQSNVLLLLYLCKLVGKGWRCNSQTCFFASVYKKKKNKKIKTNTSNHYDCSSNTWVHTCFDEVTWGRSMCWHPLPETDVLIVSYSPTEKRKNKERGLRFVSAKRKSRPVSAPTLLTPCWQEEKVFSAAGGG